MPTSTGNKTGFLGKIGRRRARTGGEGGPPPILRILKALGFIFLGAGLILVILGTRSTSTMTTVVETPHPVAPLSTVIQAAEEGKIVSVGLPSDSTSRVPAVATLEDGQTLPGIPENTEKVSFYVSNESSFPVASLLSDLGVEVWFAPTPLRTFGGVSVKGMPSASNTQDYYLEPGATEVDNGAGGALLAIGIVLASMGLALLIFVFIRKREYRNNIAKQNQVATESTTTFADVAGADEAVEQMRELVDFLKDPQKYERIGAKVPKGALLTGPPGTGKTLLARALAGEAGVPIHIASGSQFVEMFVGVGAKRIRQLFENARKSEKSIVFIDEIDAIARQRSGAANAGGGNQESENTLIALLTEMDGFKESHVIVIAATNRPDILDPALTRPGRLDRRIEVPLPDRRGREQILQVHAAKVPLADDVSLELFARRTPGFSGAQLQAAVNEAALEAVRRGEDQITSSSFDAAVAQVAMGKARASALVTDHDRRITAWHEAGHTICALLLADADPPVAVSIVPRGPAGGVTWMSEGDDIFLTRAKAHARLVTALGGRAAEQILLDGEFTQGASGDLQQATNIALNMAVRFGMTRLGLASREEHLGGTSSKEVAEIVEELLASALAEATDLLTEHRVLLERISTELLEREDLDSFDLHRISEEEGVTPAGTATPMTPRPIHAVRPSTDTEE